MPIRADLLCVQYSITPREVCIRYPVGQEICATLPQLTNADQAELVAQLFAQLNSALAPLSPILDIVDIVLTIVDCIKAIPEAIIKLDPTGLIECVPALLEAVNKILALIPALSLPLMLIDIIDGFILYLQAQAALLTQAAARIIAITNAALKAAEPGQFALAGTIDCINANFSIQIENLSSNNAPLNRIIGQINKFFEILGIPIMPCLAIDIDPTIAAAQIQQLINLLLKLRNLIPFVNPPIPQFGQNNVPSCP